MMQSGSPSPSRITIPATGEVAGNATSPTPNARKRGLGELRMHDVLIDFAAASGCIACAVSCPFLVS